jgi:hypothetical protein
LRWDSCTAAAAWNILCYVQRSVTKGWKEKWTLKFFPTYRILIEVTILSAGPVHSTETETGFQLSYCQNRKYHILILVFHETNRASSWNQWVVTKYKATEKVQYLHQFNICSVWWLYTYIMNVCVNQQMWRSHSTHS